MQMTQIQVECTIVETKEKTTHVYDNIMIAMQAVLQNGELASMAFNEMIVPKLQ